MWSSIRADYVRLATYRGRRSVKFALECLLFDNGFQAAVLVRASSWCKAHSVPLLGPVLARLCLFLTGVDVNPRVRIGPGLVISHGHGIVVGAGAVIGRNCLLHHGVTIGAPTPGRVAQMPTIGDDVSIGAQATIIGGVEVGDGAFVGTGVVLTSDLPPGSKITLPASSFEVSQRPAAPTPPLPDDSVSS